MREWTDIDYAQAAIDMLPDTVEEMVVFLREQKVGPGGRGSSHCPIAKWVRRWTGTPVDSWPSSIYLYGVGKPGFIHTPPHVREFMVEYDQHRITL